MEERPTGEIYLTFKQEGHQPIKLYKNKEATKENKQPHYKSVGGSAVWVNKIPESKPKLPEKSFEEEVLQL